jgi:hypothetical protein
MDIAPHDMGIRLYAGEVSITDAFTPNGKKYKLLNLPYFLSSQIEHYISWFRQIGMDDITQN